MTIANGATASAADILQEHNADGTHKSTTGSHITHAQLASGTGTNTHAQIDTAVTNSTNHLAASAAVHGLAASVNALGAKQASGLRIEYGSNSASIGSTSSGDITITWTNAFSSIACAIGSARISGGADSNGYHWIVKSYSTSSIVISVYNYVGAPQTFFADAIGIGT